MYGYRGAYPPRQVMPAQGEPGFVPPERYPGPGGVPYVPYVRSRGSQFSPAREPSSIRDAGPPGEEDFQMSRRRMPPPPPNPFDYAPRRGRSRSPRRRRTHSKTASRSRSRDRTKKKKSKKSKGKRSRSSSRSSSSSSRSRSVSPKIEYTNWLDVIKKMDTKDSSIATAAVLPPDVIAKLAAAGLWPPPGHVSSAFHPPTQPSHPPYYPGQIHQHPDGAASALASSTQADSSSNLTPPLAEAKKEEKDEKKEEAGKAKENDSKWPPIGEEQRKKFTDQRDKFSKAQDMIASELFQLQFSHAELLAKMFRAEHIDDVSAHSKLLSENMKLQNELLSKLQDINNWVGKYNDLLHDTTSGNFVRNDVQYFDPKNHFCADCKIFCESAADYLQHCTTLLHKKFAKCFDDGPWRKTTDEEPGKEKKKYEKLAPLKGLPFLLPVEAFYCKLCNCWVGDKEDTLKHMVSPEHNAKFLKFSIETPEWETEHFQKRQKAAKTTIKQTLDKLAKAKEEALPTLNRNERKDERIEHKEDRIERKEDRMERTEERSERREDRSERSGREERNKSPERKIRAETIDDSDQVDLTSGGRSIRVNMRDSVVPKREVKLEQSKESAKDPLLEAWGAASATMQDTQAFAALRDKLKKSQPVRQQSPPRLPPKVDHPQIRSIPIPAPKESKNANLKPFFIGKKPSVKSLPIFSTKLPSRSPSPPPPSRSESSSSSRRDTYQSKSVTRIQPKLRLTVRRDSPPSVEILFPPLSPKKAFGPKQEDEDDLMLLGIGRDDIAASYLRR